MRRVYVLLSGGIDSTTCLYDAVASHGADAVMGVSFFYGQRHSKELNYAQMSCARLGVEHCEHRVPLAVSPTLLTDPKQEIPNVSYDEIAGVSPTYVPFRNGLLLSSITSLLHGELLARDNDVGEKESYVYFGAHAEDAQNWAYPDCTPEFIGAMANAIYIGTYREVRLITPLQWMTKYEVIHHGQKLDVDWTLTWSCYVGGERHCGTCPTCRARKKGFLEAGVQDPTDYVT